MINPKKYYSRKVSCMRNEMDGLLAPDQSNIDQLYMNDQLRVHLNFIDQYQIKEYPNISQTLHEHGFRAIDEQTLIKEYQSYRISQGPSFTLLKPRELKKANSGQRNIILVRLALEFSCDFLDFVKNYISSHQIGKFNEILENNEQLSLISKLKLHIDYLLLYKTRNEPKPALEFFENPNDIIIESNGMFQDTISEEEPISLNFDEEPNFFY